jgi:immunoglobulin-binding protein 1
MSSPNRHLPLAATYKRALEASAKAYALPTIQEETQALVNTARDDLLQVYRAIDGLGLFSSNESIDDLATGDLIYLLIPYILSEVISRTVAEDVDRRKQQILQSEVHMLASS